MALSQPWNQRAATLVGEVKMKSDRRSLKILSISMYAASAALFVLSASFSVQAQTRNSNVRSLTEFSNSLRDLSAKVSPSVVQIVGTGYGLESDEENAGASVLSRQRSTGSGVIVSDDGYIMTNAHVIDGSRTIRVRIHGQRAGLASVFDAKLIGMDSLLDLALLKIDATGLRSLNFGNSLDVQQGELVLAFGGP